MKRKFRRRTGRFRGSERRDAVRVVEYFLLALLLVAAIASTWRFTMFRNNGAQCLFRVLPAEGAHRWRHGVLRYVGEEARFYKLRSLSFNYDMSLDRRTVTFNGVRELSAEEREFMPEVDKVILLTGPEGDLEFAGERHVEMALISWIESAPDQRDQRGDMIELEERAHRGRRVQ